jgi:Glyoxalase/Bleomycin resistance protein/Dioxygenase superfamily
MAVLRPHLALTVTDVERSIPFYEALFGTAPEKRKSGYAKFSVTEPALNFTLTQGERSDLAAFDEMDTTCCYARQDKIWVRDPDGTPWEVFATHGDTDEPGEGERSCACGETGCACAAKGAEDVCCA